MFTFIQHVLLFTSLLSSVLALPLAQRDVVDPPITSPTASTVWHVGQTETVTWNATGLPTNQTNPIGMLVLGYWYNNSENLMLDSPLATNLNYSTGQTQITVPNVPTRSDYIVVLFGDSGNASPEFTIINDPSSSTSAGSSSSPPTGSPSANPTSPPPPPSTTATVLPPADINSPDGSNSPTPVSGSSATATAPSQTTASQSSPVVVVTASVTATSTHSSAAWQKHVPSLGSSLSVALAVVVCFTFS